MKSDVEPASLREVFESLDVSLKEEPRRRSYALKVTGPYSGIGPAFDRILTHCKANGETPVEVFGVFCFDPRWVPERDLVSYACVEVGGEPIPEGEIEVRDLPQGLVASAVVFGPYGGPKVHEAYRRVHGWLHSGKKYRALATAANNSLETSDREFYPNDPDITEPDKVMTEIKIPIAPLSSPST